VAPAARARASPNKRAPEPEDGLTGCASGQGDCMTLSPLTLALSPSDGEREWLRRLRQGLVCPSDEGRRCQPALCGTSFFPSGGTRPRPRALCKSSFSPLDGEKVAGGRMRGVLRPSPTGDVRP